jgi:putative ABC transport system substrate-binding protein
MLAVLLLGSLLVSLSVGAPRAASAQPATMPVVGFLGLPTPEAYADRVAGILQGLKDSGYVEGQNVVIEYRWAHGRVEQLPALAADLARRRVAIIITSGSSPAALAAKAATTTIPIVFGTGGDPVKEGLVSSLNRPGGNATGTAVLTELMAAKRLELFRELVPKVEVIGVLANPASAPSLEQVRDTEEAARTLGQRIHVLSARSDADLDPAFTAIAQARIGALLVVADPMFYAMRAQIVARAQRHGVPAIHPRRDFVTAGGLMSYGPDVSDIYRQQGLYAGRILSGARPGELPVVQPTRFQLIVNRKSAAALGVKIPDSILLRATEVIE